MKAILIDDEKSARDALASLIATFCPQVELIGTAANGRDGVELFRSKKPTLVFLDVEMPELDGFQVLQLIGSNSIAVVFVTGYQQYAERAFEFAALDFLRKPVEPARLVQAVHRASERNQLLHTQGQYQMLIELINAQTGLADKRQHRIAFSTQTEIIYSWMNNLVHLDADTNYSYVKLVEHAAPLHIGRHLRDYERQFEGYGFMVRVHRSHIVNLYHVKKYIKEDQMLLMTDNKKIPVSDGNRDSVLGGLRDLGIEH